MLLLSLFPIGVAVVLDLIFGIFGIVLFGACACVICIACAKAEHLVQAAKFRTYSKALGIVRHWVLIDLNRKYQNQYGIKWNVFEEKVTMGVGKKSTTIMHLHIVVQCVDAIGAEEIMQQPTTETSLLESHPVVYTNSNINPVNHQQKIQFAQVRDMDFNCIANSAAAAHALAPEQQRLTSY